MGGTGGVREKWILAVDLGNGGPKVARVALDGTILGTAFRPVDVHIGLDGSATQDAGQWWDRLIEAAREVIDGADAGALHAVAITGQWGSTVPVGFDSEPVGPALLWADTRARDLVQPLIGGPINVGGYAPHKALPFIRLAAGAPNTDGADPTGHALLLKTRFAEIYSRTATLLEPVDYLGLRFTGRVAATPASMTLSWLTNHRPGAEPGYVDALIARTSRDRAKLPELLPTGSVLGPLLPSVAEGLGLAPGAPVVCGLPDLHAAVLGSGAVAPYATHVAISTTAWIGARVPFKRTDLFHSIATVPGLDPTLPIVANNHETGGAALQWLRDRILRAPPAEQTPGAATGSGTTGPDIAMASNGVTPGPSFEEMTAWAAGAPAGSEGLLFTPWLSGERSPVDDKHLRGGWLNLSLRTDRAALVRSVMEGVAYNMRWLFDPYQRFLRRRVESVRILGGGAVSDLWCQLHADIMGCHVERVADPQQAQLRGVALWARICLGELTIDDARRLVPVADRFDPQPENRAVYAAGYAEFRRLAGTLKGFYHRTNGRSPHG